MTARIIAMHSEVPAYAFRSPRSGVWTLWVRCPWCGAVHAHGGGDGDAPYYGWRAPHCLAGSPPDYELVPGPADMAKPTARRTRRPA